MYTTHVGYVSADWFATCAVVEDFDGVNAVYAVMDRTVFPHQVIKTFRTLNEAMDHLKE